MTPTTSFRFFCSLVFSILALSLAAQETEKASDVDDRFESANQAAKVSPPALSQKAPFAVPFRVRYSELDESELLPASNLERLAEMENRDSTVVGIVDSVFIPRGNNKVILNFSKDHRNCFKAVIDIRDFEKWGTSDPQQIGRLYEGKTLAVSGLLTTFQEKPQILIGLPHQLLIITGK